MQPPEPRSENCRFWCDLARELGKCTVICQRLRWESIDASGTVASMDDYPVEHISREAARERGWQGGTRTVRLAHIRQMLLSAVNLVNQVDDTHFPEPAPGGEVEGSRNALLVLERAVNLMTHAAAELEDERLRLRDGWPA